MAGVSRPGILGFNPGRASRLRRLLAMVSAGCAMVVGAVTVHARDVAGVNMPEFVIVGGKQLRLNGMGLRKEKALFKVDVVGLYLESPTSDPQTAIESEQAKRIAVRMLRDVKRETLVQAVETAVMRNSSPIIHLLRTRLDQLEEALPSLKKGDLLDLTYLPDRGTLVRGQGQEMTIPGKDFADAMFSAWLGPKPLDATLQRELLGR